MSTLVVSCSCSHGTLILCQNPVDFTFCQLFYQQVDGEATVPLPWDDHIHRRIARGDVAFPAALGLSKRPGSGRDGLRWNALCKLQNGNNFTPCTSTRGWTGRAPRCPGGISTLFEHQVLQGLANFATQEVKPWQQDGQAVALLSKSRGPHRIMLFLQHNVQDAVDAGRLAINVLSSMALVPWCWNQSWPMTADGVRIPSCWHFLNPLSIEWFVCWFGSTNLTLKKWHFLPAYQECVHLHKSENG